MENTQKQKVGAGILIISIIHLFLNSIGALGLVAMITMKDVINKTIKETGAVEVTTSNLIISIIFLGIIALGVILILLKKQIGVFIYFIAEVVSIIYAVVSNGFDPKQIVSLILPILMGLFIWQKKELFGFKNKDVNQY